MCQQSHPCRGHEGVKIHFNTGNSLNYLCSSVDIGLVMYYFDVETVHGEHFLNYVTDDMRKELRKMK